MIRYKNSLLAIIVGSFIISIGINSFFVPFHILDGGMIGLGLIAHYQFNISVGSAILIMSLPIYLMAWHFYRSFFYNSIVGFVISALFIDLFQFFIFPFETTPIIAAIVGGVMLGVGVGIMFVFDISTGGLDLLGQMLADISHVNVGVIIFFLDMVVVFLGFSVISKEEMILSAIAVSATGVSTTGIVMIKDYFHSQTT